MKYFKSLGDVWGFIGSDIYHIDLIAERVFPLRKIFLSREEHERLGLCCFFISNKSATNEGLKGFLYNECIMIFIVLLLWYYIDMNFLLDSTYTEDLVKLFLYFSFNVYAILLGEMTNFIIKVNEQKQKWSLIGKQHLT